MSASRKDYGAGPRRFFPRVHFDCPGKCGHIVAAGYFEPDHAPAAIHPLPACPTFVALDPDELLVLANKKYGDTSGFDA